MPEPLRKFFKSGHASIKYAMGQIDIYGNVFHECYELYLLHQKYFRQSSIVPR